jgi:hypothetical protein
VRRPTRPLLPVCCLRNRHSCAPLAREATEEEEARVRELFERVDGDSSGKIGISELAGVAEMLGVKLNEQKLNAILTEIHGNSDHNEREVTLQEFDMWLHSSSEIGKLFVKKLPSLIAREAKARFPYIPGLSDFAKHVVTHHQFEWVVIGIVAVNVTFMAMEHHDQSVFMNDLLWGAEVFFAVVYVAEAAFKIVGRGLIPYFEIGMNKLDFLCVVASVVGIFLHTVKGLAAFRIFRLLIKLLRVMRMVKIFARYDTVILLVKTITGSSALLGTLSCFIIFMLLLLSIMASHVLGPCHVPEIYGINDFSVNTTGFQRENFYSFGDAVLTNFQIATGEDWAPIMYKYMHCFGPSSVIYFIFAFAVMNFFFVNMFIAVVLENFELSEEEILVKQQKIYDLEQASLAMGDADEEPQQRDTSLGFLAAENGLRKGLNGMFNSVVTEVIVVIVILISSVAIAIEGPEDAKYLEGKNDVKDMLFIINQVVFWFFAIECLLRILALGFIATPNAYLKDSWNQLDFFIVLVATTDYIVTIVTGNARTLPFSNSPTH